MSSPPAELQSPPVESFLATVLHSVAVVFLAKHIILPALSWWHVQRKHRQNWFWSW